MISRPGLFFAMLIGMAVVMPAQADKLDDIIASGKLRCAVVLDFPPMGSRDEKNQCSNWKIEWQAGRAQYSGTCRWKDQVVEVSGRIVATADTYSDTQDQKKEGSAPRSPILDIINGQRLAPCPN